MAQVIGFDPGNSEASMLAQASDQVKQTSLTIPSYIGSGTLAALRRLRGGTQSGGLTQGEYVVEMDGRSAFVGALALEQSEDATSGRGDVTRYWNGHTRWLMLALLAAVVRSGATVRIVTGLPVQVWSKENVQRVQQSLVGDYHYTWNGRTYRYTVEAVLVVMEGAGAQAIYGAPGDVPQGVIDVGGRTTDLLWMQGIRPILPRCSGLPSGIEKIGDLVAATFLAEHGRQLRPIELRGVLRAFAGGVEHPPLFVGGSSVHLNGALRAAVSSVGDEIASFVARTWRSGEQGGVASEAARVLFIGGGPYFLTAPLRALIPYLIVPDEPETANARGYLEMGSQLSDATWNRIRGL